MSGQLGNEWDASFQFRIRNNGLTLCDRLRFFVRCHRVMCSTEDPPLGAGARHIHLLRRFRVASHIHSDSLKTCKGSVLSWHSLKGDTHPGINRIAQLLSVN